MKIPEQNNPYNANKVLYHTDKLEKLRNNELFAPTCIQIDLEAFCPHDCGFCAYRNAGFNATGMQFLNPEWADPNLQIQTGKPKGKVTKDSHIPKEIALNLLKQMKQEGIKAIEITGGGESLAYPYIKEFLQSCIDNDIEVALVTNGQLLNKTIMDLLSNCNLKWIRFSMDARNARTYAKVHGSNEATFFKIVDIITQMVFIRENSDSNFIIGISFVITKDNYNEIYDAANFWEAIGVDNIRFTFEYNADYDSGLSEEQMNRVSILLDEAKEKEDDTFKVFAMKERPDYYARENDDFSFCGYQFFTWAIGYNGKVYPCCIQKYYPGFEIGDINSESLHDIIYGEKRKAYIERFNVKACKSCWLRSKNQVIEEALSKPMHENFV